MTLTVEGMAAEIATAMAQLVPLKAHEDTHGRAVLALSVARGVLLYLSENPSTLHVAVPDTGGATVEQTVTVDIDLGTWPPA